MSQSLTLEELKQHRHPLIRNDFDLFIIRYEADIDPDAHRITQLVVSLRSSAGKIRRFRFINPVEYLGQVSANGILESGPIYIVDTRFKGWELMKVEVGIDAEDRDTLFFAESVEEIPYLPNPKNSRLAAPRGPRAHHRFSLSKTSGT